MKVKVWSILFICVFGLISMSGCNKDEQVGVPTQPYITSVTDINEDQMEVTFAYELSGEIKTHSLISQRLPDCGLEPQDRVHIKLIDIDVDGTPELVCKVYYVGNTFTEFCGDLYVYRVTEEGVENVINLGEKWEIPDERWIKATYSTDTDLYVETGTKRWEDGELYTDPIVYKVECIDDAWVTTECELPENAELTVW